MMISSKKLRTSLKNAGRGIAEAYSREHSFRIHVLALAFLLVLIWGLGIKGAEAAILILVATSVLVLELANSVFERLIDIVSPRVGSQVRDAKDIMAGAVLIASLASVVIGAFIIIPHLF